MAHYGFAYFSGQLKENIAYRVQQRAPPVVIDLRLQYQYLCFIYRRGTRASVRENVDVIKV